jgi:hypothetical protein
VSQPTEQITFNILDVMILSKLTNGTKLALPKGTTGIAPPSDTTLG